MGTLAPPLSAGVDDKVSEYVRSSTEQITLSAQLLKVELDNLIRLLQ
jgi:hypothetical protein